MTTYHRFKSRAAFTLVELLVAITIIAILAGFLTPAVFRALSGAREAAIVIEMRQLDLAIEQFENDFGFYPPSFESGFNAAGNPVGISSAADLRRFVNRISPNNAEWTLDPTSTTQMRLERWWDEVGMFLDSESSLVFWLSGICKNKQFPITGGESMSLAAHSFGSDPVERDIRFEFKTAQVVFDPSNNLIARYEQAHGVTDGDKFFRYRDAATYDIGGDAASTVGDAYRAGDPSGSESVAPYQFANPNSFQLVSPGMDGLSGAPGNVNAVTAGVVQRASDGGSNVDFTGFHGADNICNFAEGRLERFVFENQLVE